MNQNEKDKLKKDKAQKHMDICLKAVEIIGCKYHPPDYNFFINSHRSKEYKELQQDKKKKVNTFWGISTYYSEKPLDHKKIKDPDIIITDKEKVLFFIEVKWGTIKDCSKDCSDSDLDLDSKEFDKMLKVNTGKVCRVRGPAYNNGEHLDKKKRKKEGDYKFDNTQFLLVSDFYSMKSNLSNYDKILSSIKELESNFEFVDINKRVDKIPSLQQVICRS